MSYKKAKGRTKMMALIAAVISLAVLFSPVVADESSDAATGSSYSYTISTSGKITSGTYTAIASDSSSTGSYVSSEGKNSGSWGFTSDGYGPFNSFYAAFDPAQNNKMICHLNPNNLMESVDKKTDITGKDYNIMWCLPTVYWKTDSSGNLILTNDSTAGGKAYAHTIDGVVYKYLAIGVYEASTATVDGSKILTSTTGNMPTTSLKREVFRDYANNQSVNTDGGSSTNGYAMVWNFYQWELYKYCALAVMGSWDSQGVAGNGCVYDSNLTGNVAGLLNTSGPYAGTKGTATNTTYNQHSVKVFIENAWGSVYDFVDGVVINGKSGYIIDTKSVPDDTQTASDNTTNYITWAGQTLPSSGWGSSPSTEAKTWGMPTANGGSSSTGLCDYVYTSTSTARVLYVGGFAYSNADNAPKFGLSCANANNGPPYAVSYIGGRLAFVFDADPASISTPTATLNHAALTEILNDSGAAAAELTQSIELTEGGNYPNLGTVNHCEHIGWEVNGKTLAVDASFDSLESHEAKSLWKAIPYVTFDHTALTSLGGSASGLDTEMTIESASTVYPDLGTKDGYTHAGWYVNGTFYSIGSKVVSAASHTAYSAWMVPQITITFVVEDKEYATLAVQKNTSGVVFTPKMVTGVFEGWYTDSACTVKYDPTKTLSTDTTLYAKGVPPLVFTSVPTATASIANVTANMYYFDATDSTGRYAIEWDFGDGNTSTDPIAYNTYTDPGHYTVTLKITNLYGDTDTKTYGIDVGDVKEQTDAPSKTPAIIGIFAVIVLSALVVRRFV